MDWVFLFIVWFFFHEFSREMVMIYTQLFFKILSIWPLLHVILSAQKVKARKRLPLIKTNDRKIEIRKEISEIIVVYVQSNSYNKAMDWVFLFIVWFFFHEFSREMVMIYTQLFFKILSIWPLLHVILSAQKVKARKRLPLIKTNDRKIEIRKEISEIKGRI